jgi:hypothetical protein
VLDLVIREFSDLVCFSCPGYFDCQRRRTESHSIRSQCTCIAVLRSFRPCHSREKCLSAILKNPESDEAPVTLFYPETEPVEFAHILRFLKTGRLLLKDEVGPAPLRLEAEFFQLGRSFYDETVILSGL